jgi:hypothetical protein
MDINQAEAEFRPITITLESRREAQALFDLIEMLDAYVCNEGVELPPDGFTQAQRELMIRLSNARTDRSVTI